MLFLYSIHYDKLVINNCIKLGNSHHWRFKNGCCNLHSLLVNSMLALLFKVNSTKVKANWGISTWCNCYIPGTSSLLLIFDPWLESQIVMWSWIISKLLINYFVLSHPKCLTLISVSFSLHSMLAYWSQVFRSQEIMYSDIMGFTNLEIYSWNVPIFW